jgi:hypothetical protein
MHRLWLIFAQTVTVALAMLFVVTTLKPEWLPTAFLSCRRTLAVQEASDASRTAEASRPPPSSYRDACARRPASRGAYLHHTGDAQAQRHPLFDDPIFRHFFGERPEGRKTTAQLGARLRRHRQRQWLHPHQFPRH